MGRKIERRFKHADKNVPWWVTDKAKLHNFADENSTAMLKVCQYWDIPSQLETLEGPKSRFVLKPTVMHSNRGVATRASKRLANTPILLPPLHTVYKNSEKSKKMRTLNVITRNSTS